MEDKLIKFLSRFVTSQRLDTFNNVLNNRTKYISVILEDIYQSQNASAVLRTCDCFGIQDVYIIENKNQFKVNPHVALGSSNWLNIIKYNKDNFNSLNAINDIKKKGFRIIAASQRKDNLTIDQVDIKKGRIAFLFGSEHKGLSKEAQSLADEITTIPMFGFTESFNISVSTSIILYNVISKLRKSNIPWNLTEEEKKQLLTNWLKSSIKKSDLLVKKFYEEIAQG
jgi:tRNA (guanosine-2'-O-)-methyltransferase